MNEPYCYRREEIGRMTLVDLRCLYAEAPPAEAPAEPAGAGDGPRHFPSLAAAAAYQRKLMEGNGRHDR
jgi:hypothetical protein